MYIIIFFALFIAYFEIMRLISLCRQNKEGTASGSHFIIHYPIIGVLSLISMVYLLYNNYIFLNFINSYRIQAYPDSTLYCYVSFSSDTADIIHPCEVSKVRDENRSIYYLNTVYLPDGELDLSESDVYLSPDKYEKKLLSDEYGQNYEFNMKLINIKYKPTTDIKRNDEFGEYIHLIFAFFNLLYIFDCFFTCLNHSRKLYHLNKYFETKFGHFKNLKTDEYITDIQSYIDALNFQEEMNKEHNN